VRVDFSTNGTKKAKLRLLPNGIYAIYWGIKYGSFDLKTTIYTGNVAFKSYNPNINIGGTPTIGHSFDRAFIYTVNQLNNTNIDNTNRIIAHEIVHLFQYREYQLLNTWVKPLEKKVTSKFLNAIFSKYIYADIPYFWGAYRLAGSTQEPHYYRNYFEFEAERMATNRQILNR
jgi:hypothetical protein